MRIYKTPFIEIYICELISSINQDSHKPGWAIDNNDGDPNNIIPVEEDTTSNDEFLDLD